MVREAYGPHHSLPGTYVRTSKINLPVFLAVGYLWLTSGQVSLSLGVVCVSLFVMTRREADSQYSCWLYATHWRDPGLLSFFPG